MSRNILAAFRLFLVLTLLTGAAYPLLVLGLGKAFFPDRAGGSLIHRNGAVVGSAFVGQKFSSPKYFWSRPSASDYGAVPSGASNLSPAAKKLSEAVAERRAALPEDVGPEMLFASGSGLDPEISPESARAQIERIMRERGVNREWLEALIAAHTQPRDFGFLGRERVNVLRLNLALDIRPDNRPAAK